MAVSQARTPSFRTLLILFVDVAVSPCDIDDSTSQVGLAGVIEEPRWSTPTPSIHDPESSRQVEEVGVHAAFFTLLGQGRRDDFAREEKNQAATRYGYWRA